MHDPLFPFGSNPGPLETAVPIFWRPAVLARRLGLSRQSVYKAIKRGDLHAIPIAGALRVSEASVLEYLGRCAGGAE